MALLLISLHISLLYSINQFIITEKGNTIAIDFLISVFSLQHMKSKSNNKRKWKRAWIKKKERQGRKGMKKLSGLQKKQWFNG
jgi:hypothetical protein